MGRLLLLFILVPLVDAYLLIHIAAAIGGWNTIALVIATGVCGAWLFKLQGARAWRTWQRSLAEGRLPEEGVLGGALLLVGGALLITPGVITDIVGLLLLLPSTRKIAAALLRPAIGRHLQQKADSPRVRVVHFGGASHAEPVWGYEPPVDAARGDAESHEAVLVGKRVEVSAGRRRPKQVIDVDFDVTEDD